MSFINIFIENSCSIKVKDNKLTLKNQNAQAEYPIEDINTILIDCLYNEITLYSLLKLCENGATVMISDERHIPSCVLLPFNVYYKKLSVLNRQIELSKPKQKILWQSIIKQKIISQAECLKINGKENFELLLKIANGVASGDSENAEARAAVIYFKSIFGTGFTREQDNFINSCLNYCYAIVRALISRHLCARGFECSMGIFHKNQLNAFNLADDMIEPFRPIIDNFVINAIGTNNELLPSVKKALFGIVNLEVISGNERHSLSYAVERQIESLLSYYNGDKTEIIMPSISTIKMHEYE